MSEKMLSIVRKNRVKYLSLWCSSAAPETSWRSRGQSLGFPALEELRSLFARSEHRLKTIWKSFFKEIWQTNESPAFTLGRNILERLSNDFVFASFHSNLCQLGLKLSLLIAEQLEMLDDLFFAWLTAHSEISQFKIELWRKTAGIGKSLESRRSLRESESCFYSLNKKLHF